MNATTEMAPAKIGASAPASWVDRTLGAFRTILEIIRDYGMPTVAFGAGIYGFLLVLQATMAPEWKAGIALVLTLMGLLSQLWVFARDHPRAQSHELTNHLEKMTNLVERLVAGNSRSS